MSFLSPWAAMFAAAISIPALLLLYMLRLRRRPVRIASTLLWRQAFEDLQANVPFQRIRWSWLLALQLLLFAALLLAFGEPVIRAQAPSSARMMLLIDCSASMNTIAVAGQDGPRTRLDLARTAALGIIDSVGEHGGPQQVMVIAFASQPRVICTFQSNREVLRNAIESVAPTDESGDLDAALRLAAGYAGSADETQSAESLAPEAVLLSDGGSGSADGRGHQLRHGRFRFLQVTPMDGDQPARPIDNVGVTSLGVRRDPDDPGKAMVFARLVNASSQPQDVSAVVLVNNRAATTLQVALPAASNQRPGEQSITATVELSNADESDVIAVRQTRPDDLSADDVAAAVLPPPRFARLALVHPDDAPADEFLVELLEAVQPQSAKQLSQTTFEQLDAATIDSGQAYDLIVFDRVAADRLPATPTITIGAVPAGLRQAQAASAASTQVDLRGESILSWDRQHPLMRSVSLDTVLFAGAAALDLPAGATPLAYGRHGPVMALVRSRGVGHVVVAFEMMLSNWALHMSSLLFMQNAFDYLTPVGAGLEGITRRPGEALLVRPSLGAERIRIRGPQQLDVPVRSGGQLTPLPLLRRAGLYEIDGVALNDRLAALSVLSDAESDNRPRESVVVNARSAQAARPGGLTPRPLWPWLVAGAMLLLLIEWAVYCRRAGT